MAEEALLEKQAPPTCMHAYLHMFACIHLCTQPHIADILSSSPFWEPFVLLLGLDRHFSARLRRHPRFRPLATLEKAGQLRMLLRECFGALNQR